MFRNDVYYVAPKPTYPKYHWLYIITARIFFPPILLWDLLKYVMNRLLGSLVSRIVLPAQDMKKFKVVYTEHPSVVPYKRLNRIKVITHDGAHLDTIEFKHLYHANEKVSEQICIIKFNGNGVYSEDLSDKSDDESVNLKCNVVIFNYRNVNLSTGILRSKDDLVTDGIAQVQRLLDQGYKPDHIILHGFSLGGAVASCVAFHFHQLGIQLNLFNERSFSTVSNSVVGWIRTSLTTGHQESLFRIMLGYIFKPVIMFALALVKWDIDAISAYQQIPAENKRHLVVRSAKQDRNIILPQEASVLSNGNPVQVKDDIVISHYASIHAALKPERRAIKQQLRNTAKSEQDFRQKRQEMDKCKFTLLPPLLPRNDSIAMASTNAHNQELKELFSRYDQKTGDEYFGDFIGYIQQRR